MAKLLILFGLLSIIAAFLIMNYWPKLEINKRNKLLKLTVSSLIILLIIILILLIY